MIYKRLINTIVKHVKYIIILLIYHFEDQLRKEIIKS